jgi:hypothetical protein
MWWDYPVASTLKNEALEPLSFSGEVRNSHHHLQYHGLSSWPVHVTRIIAGLFLGRPWCIHPLGLYRFRSFVIQFTGILSKRYGGWWLVLFVPTGTQGLNNFTIVEVSIAVKFFTEIRLLALCSNPQLEGVPILVVFYDMHGLHWDYSFPRSPHGDSKRYSSILLLSGLDDRGFESW